MVIKISYYLSKKIYITVIVVIFSFWSSLSCCFFGFYYWKNTQGRSFNFIFLIPCLSLFWSLLAFYHESPRTDAFFFPFIEIVPIYCFSMKTKFNRSKFSLMLSFLCTTQSSLTSTHTYNFPFLWISRDFGFCLSKSAWDLPCYGFKDVLFCLIENSFYFSFEVSLAL